MEHAVNSVFIDLSTPVTHIMTRNVRFVEPDTIVSKIAQMFQSERFHHLPVLGDDGEVLGIISKSDLLQLQNHLTRLSNDRCEDKNEWFFKTLTAEEIMTKKPSCIHCQSTIGTAIEIFLENLFHALPVVDGGQCIGILTTYDVMRFIQKTQEALTTSK